MKKVAVLVDGGFYLKRFHYFSRKEGKTYTPKQVAKFVYLHARRHIKPTHQELYRILFYDCKPISKKVHHPITNKVVDLSKSHTFQFKEEFFTNLVRQPMIALRLGELDEKNGAWRIKDEKRNKQLITGKISTKDLSNDEYYYHCGQKGVDMKIGLDIATLTLKKLVDKVVLVAGDSDFVPAAKLARREGIRFVLDSMGRDVKANLSEHIDAHHTTIPTRLRQFI